VLVLLLAFYYSLFYYYSGFLRRLIDITRYIIANNVKAKIPHEGSTEADTEAPENEKLKFDARPFAFFNSTKAPIADSTQIIPGIIANFRVALIVGSTMPAIAPSRAKNPEVRSNPEIPRPKSKLLPYPLAEDELVPHEKKVINTIEEATTTALICFDCIISSFICKKL